MITRKAYSLKGVSLEENCLKANTSCMGYMDEEQDVIFPTAFKSGKCLPDFLTNGFIALSHDWAALPIAMPTMIKEDGNMLYSEAEYHNTVAAQEARTVAMERMDKGLTVPVSIGFRIGDNTGGGYSYFENGAKLLDFADKNGFDLGLFDTKQIKQYTNFCRGIMSVSKLYEWSQVTVPANQRALAVDAKGLKIASLIESGPTQLEEVLSSLPEGSPLALSVKGLINQLHQLKKDGLSACGDGILHTERGFEEFLRDAGFSRKLAKGIVTVGLKAALRDAGTQDDSDIPPVSDETLSRVKQLRIESLRRSMLGRIAL